MAVLAPALNHSSAELSSISLVARCSNAAEILWHLENTFVVMPFTESPESRELRSILQGIGLTVLNGFDPSESNDCESLDAEKPVLVVVHASDWKIEVNRQKLTAAASLSATMLCVVTGLVSLPDPLIFQQSSMFNDARLLLGAAGIGFFSIEGVRNGLVA